jgi:signal transduction histidine kinase
MKGFIAIKAEQVDRNLEESKDELLTERLVQTQRSNDNILDQNPLHTDGSGKSDHHVYVRTKFSVQDSGIGIKEEDIGKLFKLFGKLDQVNHEVNAQGIGLGLTICNNILNQFNSKLEIQSTEGVGTMFYFIIDLPVKQVEIDMEDSHFNLDTSDNTL